MTITGTIALSWSISCAKWNNDPEFSNINVLHVRQSEMWIPIIVHYNSINNYYLNPSDMSLPNVLVISEGIAIIYMVGIFTSKCEFRFKKFLSIQKIDSE